MHHDVVVIGASAGGIPVLFDLVPELPADLPAAVFVVVHLPPDHVSALPELLSRRGPLPARHPEHNEPVATSRIYVAPPDNHLQLRDSVIEVVRGPKDNGHRPAVDVLFRTAARTYGARTVGVVLSGYQDCGTAGMLSIKARGGIAIVQDPDTAVAPDMPRNVLAQVEVDQVVHPAELAAAITRAVRSPAGPARAPADFVRQIEGELPGYPADLVCPICEGVLTETQPGVFQHFRCHVGHAFSLDALVRVQGDEMERVLWAAVRALEESAALAERMVRGEPNAALRQRYVDKGRAQRQQAEYLRRLLLHGPAWPSEEVAAT